MKLKEFEEQDKYCKEHNTPEGAGCHKCPAKDKLYCADALRNLCGRLLATLHHDLPTFHCISKEIENDYGLTIWNQLSIFKGELEFPD